ncbi:MAG: ogr/Delta-like zinc finger family protein [Victivallaceae bacterium]|nr:ogr/Delta-like zinc finger family protein [Victivallaceae bacterium]
MFKKKPGAPVASPAPQKAEYNGSAPTKRRAAKNPGGTVRIYCPYCQTKMIITHPVRINNRVSDLYTVCPNVECGARCVMRLSHISDLTPPAPTLTAAMHEWFANLPEAEQKAIARTYQPALF